MHNRFLSALMCSIVTLACPAFAAQQQAFWDNTGGPLGGMVYAMTADATGNVYISTDIGVFRSTNDGVSWNPTATIPYLVNALFRAGNRILAGTDYGVYATVDNGVTWGSPDSSFLTYGFAAGPNGSIYATSYQDIALDGRAFYKSTDNGVTWAPTGAGIPEEVTVYCMDFVSTTIVLAGSDTGVCRSIDGGATWAPSALPVTKVYAFLNVGASIFAATTHGLVRSSDNGISWRPEVLTGSLLEAYALAQINGELFVGAEDGLYKSAGVGNPWSLTTVSNEAVNVVVSPNGVTVLVGCLGINGVKRSINAGTTFVSSNIGLPCGVNSLVSDGKGGMLAGGYGGVTAYNETSKVWGATNLNSFYTTFAVANLAGNTFAACTDNGVYLSINNGSTWGSSTVSDAEIRTIARSGGLLFGGTNQGMVYSSDIGVSWDTTGLASDSVFALLSPASGSVVAGTNRGAFATSDAGVTWLAIGLTDTAVYALAQVGNYLLAGTERGVYSYSLEAATWFRIGLADTSILTLLATSVTELYASTQYGVVRSTDGGTTWTDVSNGLGGTLITSMAQNDAGYLFVGSRKGGVYRSAAPITGVHDIDAVPDLLSIDATFPNPCSAATQFDYSVASEGRVTIDVSTPLGAIVQRISNSHAGVGRHHTMIDVSSLRSGVYSVRITCGGVSANRTIVVTH